MSRPTNVPAEDFIRIWQRAKNLKEVCSVTGLRQSTCMTRAAYYRALGVPIRRFKRHKPQLDVAKLSELARSITPPKRKT